MTVAFLCIAIFSSLLLLYHYFKYRFEKKVKKFKELGINAVTPSFPFGNIKDMVRMKRHIVDLMSDVYNRFPEDRFVIFYVGTSPVFLIRDLNLIKNIAIKHFDYFTDHSVIVDKNQDVLLGQSIFCLKGDEWKELRKTLNPAFAPNRLKAMSNLFMKASKQMITHYQEIYENKKLNEDNTMLEINLHHGMASYFVDLTAMAGFGIDVNSFKAEHELFFKNTMKMAWMSVWHSLKLFGFAVMPRLMKVLKIRLIPPATVDYFKQIVAENIRYRQENNIHKTDFLDVIRRLGNGTLENDKRSVKSNSFVLLDEKWDNDQNVLMKKEWSLDELTSQAAGFMIAGIETSTTSFGFILYELAMNQHVQKKLQVKIDEALAAHGEFTYDVVQGIEYLNMVISESLRKYSLNVERICVRDIDIGAPRPGENPYTIKKGDWVMFSIQGIQRDPKYWPNPMKFDPERFSKANRQNIVPYSFFPFGIGPRICIGFSFAEIALKMGVATLLSKFDIVTTDRTPDALRRDPMGIAAGPADGYVALKLRNLSI